MEEDDDVYSWPEVGSECADTGANKINVTEAAPHMRHRVISRFIPTSWVMHASDRLRYVCVHLNDSMSELTPLKQFTRHLNGAG